LLQPQVGVSVYDILFHFDGCWFLVAKIQKSF